MDIQVDELAQTVNDILQAYGDEVKTIQQEVINQVAKEGVAELKSTSPKKTGKYARDWKATETKNTLGQYVKVIHNKQYQLTHLLEYGHDLITPEGKKYGRADAHPHIAPAEQKIISQYEEELTRKLNGIK